MVPTAERFAGLCKFGIRRDDRIVCYDGSGEPRRRAPGGSSRYWACSVAVLTAASARARETRPVQIGVVSLPDRLPYPRAKPGADSRPAGIERTWRHRVGAAGRLPER
jgi:hypothetical protein